jgi:hypothetical protein
MIHEDELMPQLGTGTRVQEDCEKQWRPTRMECLRNHQINIEFLSMGCIIRVGCMSIPFQFVNDAVDAIKAYTENPYEERQRWEKLIESRQ